MTLSVDDRKSAMTRVIILLAEMFREAPFRQFSDDDVAKASPLPTTLDEMKHRGWIRVVPFFGGREYELTKTGWFDGQRIAGYFETPDTNGCISH